MLLAVRSGLMSQQHTHKEEERIPVMTLLQKALKAVHDEVMEKMERRLSLWIHEVTTD